MRFAIAQPCFGSAVNVLRISRSSVPWMRSDGLPTCAAPYLDRRQLYQDGRQQERGQRRISSFQPMSVGTMKFDADPFCTVISDALTRAAMVWEQRWHPLRREWVVISSHRDRRPWQGETVGDVRAPRVDYDPTCYLCP